LRAAIEVVLMTDVQIDDARNMRVAGFERGHAAEHQAGVVDQAVDAAEMRARGRHDARTGFRVRHIAAHQQRFDLGLFQFLGERLSGRFAGMIIDRNARTLRAESTRQCSADASGSAGDKDDLVGQIGNAEPRGFSLRHQVPPWRVGNVARIWLLRRCASN
jgi:hypothetical protein